MKKILFLLLTVVTVCSCYNDDDLWDKVNDLDGRVETLETTVKKMNSENYNFTEFGRRIKSRENNYEYRTDL